MGNLLYYISIVLIMGWIISFFVFHVGGYIHVVLLIALIVVILKVIIGKRPAKMYVF